MLTITNHFFSWPDGYGRCPMLVDGKCSIYNYRPITCRNYDCRIFPAAGISAGDNEKALINEQSQRWKFSYPTQQDRNQHSAVKTAAKFLQEHFEYFPAGTLPSNPSKLAILAIKVYSVFLKYFSESGKTKRKPSDLEIAKAIIAENEEFETRHDKRIANSLAN